VQPAPTSLCLDGLSADKFVHYGLRYRTSAPRSDMVLCYEFRFERVGGESLICQRQ